MSSLRASVAMCTYQGERHLSEQLSSIAEQTLLPDELVVCDDGSTDGTLAIVSDFKSEAPFPVRVFSNDGRLGFTKNFEKAIALSKGDLIFLADQDDVWHPEKLSSQLAIFASSPAVAAVFTDGDVVSDDLSPLGYTVWSFVGFAPSLQRRFANGGALDVLLKRQIVVGMTMGFRSRYRNLILPMPAEWVHDRWISLLIGCVADLATVPLRLVKYRQHQGQVIGMAKKGFLQFISERRQMTMPQLDHLAELYAVALERLKAKLREYPPSPGALKGLEGKVQHLRARAAMRAAQGRLGLVLREMVTLNYKRYSSGWKSIATDVFLTKR
jgi:glycosyltransferase involved in cell wall biosynthesis